MADEKSEKTAADTKKPKTGKASSDSNSAGKATADKKATKAEKSGADAKNTKTEKAGMDAKSSKATKTGTDAKSSNSEKVGTDVKNSKPDYEQEILTIIQSTRSGKKLRSLLNDYHENDIAEIFPSLTPIKRRALYRALPVSTLSDIFEYMDEEDVPPYLDEMDLRKAADVLSDMEPDDASDILSSISAEKRVLLVDRMDLESIREVNMIDSFSDEEIGSRMTTNYIQIDKDLSIKDAMRELIQQAAENDNISTIFIADEIGCFYGALDLHKLILARKDADLEDLIVSSFPYVYAHETIDECIEKLKDYSEDSIPVLDEHNRILGVITSQSLLEVVDDEMGEDYARFAGLTEEEDLSETLPQSIRKRLPWLIILLFLALIVSSVVTVFEKVVAQLTIIMAFQSMILGMSGNVGTQSLAVTIRVLMDENLSSKEKVGLVFKEMRIGLCNGAILGTLAFVVVTLFLFFVKGRALFFSACVSACIGISLMTAMLVSSGVGTAVPLFFKKIHVDPAVASGPLITTMNDLVAVVTYYGISWLLLIQTLHLAG